MRTAEGLSLSDRLAEAFHELLLVADGLLPTTAFGIDRQRLLQRGKDVRVVHDEAAMLAGKYTVGPGNRLHEGVVPHRLVEVDG